MLISEILGQYFYFLNSQGYLSVLSTITGYLNSSKMLNNHQFGFRSAHGNEHAIMVMTQTTLKAMDEGKVCIIVALDLQRALPSVNRKRLIRKFEKLEVSFVSAEILLFIISAQSIARFNILFIHNQS